MGQGISQCCFGSGQADDAAILAIEPAQLHTRAVTCSSNDERSNSGCRNDAQPACEPSHPPLFCPGTSRLLLSSARVSGFPFATLQSIKEAMEHIDTGIALYSPDTVCARFNLPQKPLLCPNDVSDMLLTVPLEGGETASVTNFVGGLTQSASSVQSNEHAVFQTSGEFPSFVSQQCMLYINQSLSVLFRLLEMQASFG